MAHIGPRGKAFIKEKLRYCPDEYKEKRLEQELLTQYFREYRGDNFRKRTFDVEYKTPSWQGIEDRDVDLKDFWYGPRPTDKPPSSAGRDSEPTSEELAAWELDDEGLDDEELQNCVNEREKAKVRARRKRESEEVKAKWAQKELERAEERRERAAFNEHRRIQKQIRNKQFLRSNREGKWQFPVGDNSKWVGKKVLGEGGNGLAGLWEYQGEFEISSYRLIRSRISCLCENYRSIGSFSLEIRRYLRYHSDINDILIALSSTS